MQAASETEDGVRVRIREGVHQMWLHQHKCRDVLFTPKNEQMKLEV